MTSSKTVSTRGRSWELAALLAFLFSLFFFCMGALFVMGTPDGKTGSRDALASGTVFLALGGVTFLCGHWLAKKSDQMTRYFNTTSLPIPDRLAPKSARLLFLGVMGLLFLLMAGIPWMRSLSIEVPKQEASNITVGQFNSVPVYSRKVRYGGTAGGEIFIQDDSGKVLWLSCQEPGFQKSSVACFRNQESHNQARVRVYWSEQPSGYIDDRVNRPSRIETSDGAVLFSEADAKELINSQISTHKFLGGMMLFVAALIYLPLMWILDREVLLETVRKRTPTKPQ